MSTALLVEDALDAGPRAPRRRALGLETFSPTVDQRRSGARSEPWVLTVGGAEVEPAIQATMVG
ncbi:MAG TPA: hypothetical protein VII53_06925 [Solirubrobacteraceae bacterium]